MKSKLSKLILLFLAFAGERAMATNIGIRSDFPFPEAEKYISQILDGHLPYNNEILNVRWVTKSNKTYPPGKLTLMFASYLLENDLIKNKKIADISSSCFAIGVIAAKNGAKKVIGTSITPEAAENGTDNIINNNVEEVAEILEGRGVEPLMLNYRGQIDVIVSGPPWNTISQESFEKIDEIRRPLTSLFYDIDDKLITDILTNARLLLAPSGKIFMTSSFKTIGRIKRLCADNHMSYKIVKEEDIHNDGNMQYVLMLTPQE